jgi:hypothetical protein
MLAGHRLFFANLYAMFRFLEAEVTKRSWDLIRNGGYGVTRNGMGRSMTNFASADWITTQMGIAFVRTGLARSNEGVTNTDIPVEGLDLLFFQARWLDKSPDEPAIWHGRLHVEAEGSKPLRKWEEYQTTVFYRLEPYGRADGVTSGDIKPGRVSFKGSVLLFTGTYVEVPVASLLSQEDMVSQILEPALG